MRNFRSWLARLGDMFHKSQREQDLADEFETNLQLEIDDRIRSGMSPGEARRTALLKSGGLDAAREACRERRGIPLLETLGRDVNYAFRMLRRNKGWSAVAVLSLSLGIGANSALFSLVHNYALEKLPVRNPDELVAFRWYGENSVERLGSEDSYIAHAASNERAGSNFSFHAFEQFRTTNQTLSEIFALAKINALNVFVHGEAEFAGGQFVSGNFYNALGISPVIGRTLTPQDDRESAAPVVVLSHQYWQRRFNLDPGIVGSTITINNVAFTVAGVTPGHFVDLTKLGTLAAPDITIPMMLEPRVRTGDGGSWLRLPQDWWLMVMGRLRPGVALQQAEANFRDIFDAAAMQGWTTFVASLNDEQKLRPDLGGREPRVPGLRIVPASRGTSDSQPAVINELAVLTAIFGIVLLIVCVNLANLLLSRAAARQKEIAVRLAIGASRARVIRQLMTESLVIAAAGGVLGLFLAVWSTTLLSGIVFRISSNPLPGLNLAVAVFSSVLTVLSGLAFGIVPALRATRLHKETRGLTPSQSRLGKSLLVVQVALSIVLLITAGLFLRTFWNLQRVDTGFKPENLALFRIQPSLNGYDRQRAVSLYEQLEEKLLMLPGVRNIAYVGPDGLLTDGETHTAVYVQGESSQPAAPTQASILSISRNVFDTMEIPLKSGRPFTTADTQTAPLVAIVNEAFARTFFGNANPIGRRFAGRPQAPASVQIEIVGVVPDVKVNSLRDTAPPMFYRPFGQVGFPSRIVVVRTAGDPEALLPAIRESVRSLDPRLPLRDVSTQMDRIGRGYLSNERIFAFASSFFAGLALVLAMIGLFGLMSYSVSRRTREIGIRMALGARSDLVLKAVMREALVLAALGVVTGLAGALALARLIAALLFGLAPHDPWTISIAVTLMLLVSALAGYLPARRASRVDPMVALRYE